MITIFLILAGELALILIGVGVVLEWRRRFQHVDWTSAQQLKRKAGFIGLALPTLIAVIGPLVIVAGAYHRMKYEETLEWPTTTGEITDTYIWIKTDKSGTTYRPDAAYTYTVNNREYDRGDFSYERREYRKRSDAENDLRSYPIGRRVAVRYNPDNPTKALIALTPDAHFRSYNASG